jgi:hypothetical protein
MSTDMPLFDKPKAEEAREAALADVKSGASKDWMARAVAAVQTVALGADTFTTDDLWAHVEPPREPRAMGAVMRIARLAKWCEATTLTKKSARVACHARPLRVWKSLLRGDG